MNPDRLPQRYAVLAGAGGMAALLVGGVVLKRLGWMRLDVARVLGTVAAPDRPSTRALGVALNLVTGAGFALGYRMAFRGAGIGPGPATGAAAGLVHAVGSAAALALAPKAHPRPKEAGLEDADPRSYGPLTLPGLLLGHVAFGALIGTALEVGEVRRDRARELRSL